MHGKVPRSGPVSPELLEELGREIGDGLHRHFSSTAFSGGRALLSKSDKSLFLQSWSIKQDPYFSCPCFFSISPSCPLPSCIYQTSTGMSLKSSPQPILSIWMPPWKLIKRLKPPRKNSCTGKEGHIHPIPVFNESPRMQLKSNLCAQVKQRNWQTALGFLNASATSKVSHLGEHA